MAGGGKTRDDYAAEIVKQDLGAMSKLVDLVRNRDKADGVFSARTIARRISNGLNDLFGVPICAIVNNGGELIE